MQLQEWIALMKSITVDLFDEILQILTDKYQEHAESNLEVP